MAQPQLTRPAARLRSQRRRRRVWRPPRVATCLARRAGPGQRPVPAPQALEEPAAGQVQVDRGDRDPPIDHGVEVGALHGQAGRRRPADPEVGDSARVGPLDQLVLVDALAEAGHLDTLELLERDGRYVDVDQLARRQAVFQDVARDRGRRPGREGEIGVLVVLLRDRECRAVVDDRLHRRADRARVGDVVTQVRAVVDPGRDEVEAVAEVAQEGEADRVGRRAVHRIRQRAVGERPLAHAQRPHQRLLVAHRALVGVGGHDGHVAHRLERLLEGQQAARLDAVVVGDQDARPAGPLGERPRVDAQGSRAGRAPPGRRGLAALLVEVAPLRPGSFPGPVRDVGHGVPAGCRVLDVDGAARRRLARDVDRASLAVRQPASRPSGDRPIGRRAMEELEEEGRDHGRDRDPEDRSGDAGDPGADQDRAQDHDRMDARRRPA